jgi:hypothetical protein
MKRKGVVVEELRELFVDLRNTLPCALVVVGHTKGLQ